MAPIPGRARRARTVMLVCVVLFLSVPTGRANAHAILLDTEPGIDQVVAEPPTEVTLRFTEPVEVAFGAIRVFDARSERVDAGAARHVESSNDTVEVPLEDDLPDGTYTVSWRVVSADSHPVAEAFVFHVGAPGAQPTGLAAAALEGETGSSATVGALAGAVRWVNFAGLMLLGGAAMFLLLVWRRAGHDLDGRPVEMDVAFGARWRRTIVVAWWSLVAATVAGIVLQGAVGGGLPLSDALSADIVKEVLKTRYGLVALIKLGLLAAGLGLWLTIGRSGMRPIASKRRSDEPAAVTAVPTWLVWPGGVLLVGLLATPGLAGHPAVTDPVWMNVAMDVTHVSAAAAWLGGLALLLFAALPAARGIDDLQRRRFAAPVVSRYSDLAFWSVTALVASGTYRSFLEIGALRALTSTVYGKVLLIKLSVFLPLLILGAVNNRYIKPRLLRLHDDAPGSEQPLSLLRRIVGTEVALGAAVLAVTALLVNLAPARVEAGLEGPFVTDLEIADLNVNVLIDPNEVGENLVHVTATTPEGAPARRLRAVKVRFSMPEEDIGPLVGEGRKLAPGHYAVQGRQLSIAGDWRLELVLRTGRFDEHSKKIDITVNR
jgi:copper transport protein